MFRSMAGMRFVPPAPSAPVRTRVAGGALPFSSAFVEEIGAPDDRLITGAIVKSERTTEDAFGCQMAVKLKRCGTSKFDRASSRLRSKGLRTLFAVVKVCDDCPLSIERENV